MQSMKQSKVALSKPTHMRERQRVPARSAVDTAHEGQDFRGELLAAVRQLREQAAREWKHAPVLAKTLEHIRDYLEVLLSAEFTAEGQSVARAVWLDALQKPHGLTLEEAFDIEADLRARLPELAGDDYIFMCLQHEKQRLAKPPVEKESDRRWTDLFPQEVLDELLAGFGSDNKDSWPRQAAIGRLAELYRQSHHDLRRDRARAAQVALYLKLLWPLLAVLLLSTATLLGSVEAFGRSVPPSVAWVEFVTFGAAMLVGAVGGTLGLMFRFRNAHGRIRDLLAERDLRLVQPLIGAAMALAVVLVIKSGLTTIDGFVADGRGLAPLAALGFLAGFSEPFFFGIMDRLARAASPGSSEGGKS